MRSSYIDSLSFTKK